MKEQPSLHTPLPPEVGAWITEQTDGANQGLEQAWDLAAHAAPQAPPVQSERAREIWAELDRLSGQDAGRISHLRVVRKPLTILRFASIAAAAVIVLGLSLQAWLQPTAFEAPFGETLELTLPDGSVASLNSGARLSFERSFGDQERRVHLHGEAFFSVESGEVPFIVETFNAETQVLGTRFNVRAWPEEFAPETEVVLEEGLVQISHRADHNPLMLMPGMMAVLSSDGIVFSDSTDLRYALAWRSGSLSFDDQPLAEIFDELERRYDITITTDSAIEAKRGALFMNQPEEVELVLADIAVTHGLNYRPVVGGFQVFAP